MIGSRAGDPTPLALALTGVILVATASLLPVMTASKWGSEHSTWLFEGAAAAWRQGFRLTAIWVVFCGAVAPLLVLGLIGFVHLPPKLSPDPVRTRVASVVHWFSRWAMPEVHVLAFLVAFAKLGSLVHLTIGPGLWFYAGGALMLMLAWRRFDLSVSPSASRPPSP